MKLSGLSWITHYICLSTTMIVQARARAAAHNFTTKPNEGDPNLICAYVLVKETSGVGFKKAFSQYLCALGTGKGTIWVALQDTSFTNSDSKQYFDLQWTRPGRVWRTTDWYLERWTDLDCLVPLQHPVHLPNEYYSSCSWPWLELSTLPTLSRSHLTAEPIPLDAIFVL